MLAAQLRHIDYATLKCGIEVAAINSGLERLPNLPFLTEQGTDSPWLILAVALRRQWAAEGQR